MSGAPPPSANTGASGSPEDPPRPSPTLAARLAEAEAALARTQEELEASCRTNEERDAARRAPTATALQGGAGGASGRRAGGPAADGAAGGPAPTATDAIIMGDGTPAPPGEPVNRPFVLPDAAIRRDDYAKVGDGEKSQSPCEWAGTRYAARDGGGGLPRNIPYSDDVAIFNDGLDDVKVPGLAHGL